MTQRRDTSWLSSADRRSPWERARVVVAGLGLSGFAAADALQHLGAAVTVVADSTDEASREKAILLEILGVDVRLGGDPLTDLPGDLDLVVMSPGIPPGAPLPTQAARRGLLVWGDVELAWRLRDPANPTPWLCVTGTNGKTTTVQMLEAMLRADGLRAVAAGNVGLPMCEVVMDPEPFDVLAVELSSHQLHWSSTVSAHSATVLNVAPDHLSWHGDLASYTAAKANVYERCQVSAVYNDDDPTSRRLVEEAEVVEGCRAIGFTMGIPSVGMIGLVDGAIADRAFIEGRDRNAAELARVADVSTGAPTTSPTPLAAAALARSFGVTPDAVRRGLQGFELDSHRIAEVGNLHGVRYVDDSKATNPHAALASLQAFDTVVWVAGGLAKGARFDELVEGIGEPTARRRAAGVDRGLISAALSRHASDVPVIEVSDTDTGVMERVVRAAASLAQPGDTVLLAPACASQDLFADYAARGDAFAAAVKSLRER